MQAVIASCKPSGKYLDLRRPARLAGHVGDKTNNSKVGVLAKNHVGKALRAPVNPTPGHPRVRCFPNVEVQLKVHTPSTDQDLASHVIRQRRTEKQDGACCLFRGAQASQWARTLHRLQQTGLDAEADLIAMHLHV